MDTFNKLCLHKQRSDYFPIKRGRSTLFTVVPVNEAPVVCGANQDLVSVDLLYQAAFEDGQCILIRERRG